MTIIEAVVKSNSTRKDLVADSMNPDLDNMAGKVYTRDLFRRG